MWLLFATITFASGACISHASRQKEGEAAESIEVHRSGGKIIIERCAFKHCTAMATPRNLDDQISEGYLISTSDIDDDGSPEVVATSNHGVNRCSWFYRLDKETKQIRSFNPTRMQLCNYRIEGLLLISSYRDEAKWQEDIYQRTRGSLALIAEDKCVGCGEIYRTLYENDMEDQRMVVSDDPLFTKRKQLIATVQVERADLYSTPSHAGSFAGHLARNDKVELVEYTDDDGGWYKVRHRAPNQSTPAVGWIHPDALNIER